MSRASADGLTCGKTWKLFCCLINSVPCHCLVSGLWAGLMSKQTETLGGWGPGRVLPLLVVRESFRIDTFPSALVIGSISPAAPLDCVPDSGEDRARKYSVSLLFAGSVLSCPSHSFSPGQIFVVNSQFRKEDKGFSSQIVDVGISAELNNCFTLQFISLPGARSLFLLLHCSLGV